MKWLAVSIVLTVLLNVGIRLWPGAADRGTRRLMDWTERQDPTDAARRDPRQVRVIAPWKAMLIASVVLTIGLNVVLRVL